MQSAAAASLGALDGDFLRDNLDAFDVLPQTRELVDGAAPAGVVELAKDRTPVLRLGDRILGSLPEPNVLGQPSVHGVVVVFGLGTGHTLRAVRAATDAPLVVFEPSPAVLRTVFEFGPVAPSDVTLVCSLQELSQRWAGLARGVPAATVVRTPGYAEAFPKEDGELCRAVEQLVQATSMNSVTYRRRARTWISHVLRNVDALAAAPPFQALENEFARVPIFIVGAGPSLGKNGPLLAEAAKKGIVIAVNSSGKALAKYGVEPQVLACIESVDVSPLIRDLPFIDRVVRAFSLSAHPATLETGRGPLLPVYEAMPQIALPLEKLTGKNGLAVCGSVSTVAFSLAHRLGGCPIVLVGQDLAYTGGFAYAAGTAYEGSRANVSADGSYVTFAPTDALKRSHVASGATNFDKEALLSVAGWGGGMVPSSPSFAAVRTWFEDAATLLRREVPGIRLVNATEGGARIAGFEERTLADVLQGLPDLDITAASIAAAASKLDIASPERILDWAREQCDLTAKVGRAAVRLGRLAEAAQRAVVENRPRRVARAFAALERAEQELRRAVSGSPFVDAWAYAEVDEAMSETRSDFAVAGLSDGAHAAIAQEVRLSRLVRRAADGLGRELSEVVIRLERRIAGSDVTPCATSDGPEPSGELRELSSRKSSQLRSFKPTGNDAR